MECICRNEGEGVDKILGQNINARIWACDDMFTGD